MRNAGIDRIRVGTTTLVILHHTAIVYGGSGGWFWREEPNASNLLLVMFNAVNQAWFMGLFFLLAGYFTPAALERKGPARFALDRLVRLGIPLLVFFVLLHPLTVAIANTADGEPLLAAWRRAMLKRDFAPGPLWFAEALLIFTAAYMLFATIVPRRAPPASALPPFAVLLGAALAVGAAAFAVRLVWPVGREWLWLQLGYFPGYVALFAAGCWAARGKLLEAVRWRDARPWMICSGAALASLPAVVIQRSGAGAFEGGWTLNALFYALWEPFIAWGVILGLLWAARAHWHRETPLGATLAGAAFGAYIIHPPVLVALSVAFVPLSLPPLAKFALVGTLACAASFALAAALRRLPGAARVI